ncbi:BTAD domain-containing putative transcriptional regulator [Geodermatophilus sp. SYSU D00703]
MDRAPAPRVVLLDGFALQFGGIHEGTADEPLPRGIQRLVAHLSLSGRPTRAAVAGRLWPDVPEDQAQGSLRSALWRLQKVAPGLLEVSGGSLALAAGVRVDVREFREWARAVSASGTGDADLGIPRAALCGELLPGWYDDWVLLERERLRQLRMHTLEVVAVRLATAGRHGEALQVAYAAVREEPLRESAHRVVVRVHLAEGNPVEALRAYEHFRAMLLDELGVVPTEQMVGLVCGIPRPRLAAD